MISMFEKHLNSNNNLKNSFKNYPHTITYDCSTNFAPVTIFDIKELDKYK